jgi:nucleotide-binding universal stress UspA family protein
MKFKPIRKNSGVVLELGPLESRLPADPREQVATPRPVFQLKKILVPVDFSDCSKKALQYALPFARQFEAELALVHVVQAYVAVPEMVPVEVVSTRDAESDLERLRQLTCEGVQSRAIVRVGLPHREITKAAQEFGSDLIILSTHGHTGLAHVLLGSTAERVVRHAPCPVLVVREREHEFVPDTAATNAE